MLEVYGNLYVKNKKLIENIELKLDNGIYLIIGNNGVGKSSFMKAIAGFKDYKIDKIILNNEDITKLKLNEKAKKGIIYVYQNPPTNLGISLDDFENYLGIVVNTDFDYNKILFKEFSGGESKYLDFLIALSLKPKIFLIDEPDSQLDINKIKDVAFKINSYYKENKPIVMISSHTLKILEFLNKDYIKGYLIFKNKKIIYEKNI